VLNGTHRLHDQHAWAWFILCPCQLWALCFAVTCHRHTVIHARAKPHWVIIYINKLLQQSPSVYKWPHKVLSLTFKSLKTDQPAYLCSLLSFPSHRSTLSSSPITLSSPSLTSRLQIANRSFYHSAPVLWNSLPSDLSHVAYHDVSSPRLNSNVSDLLKSVFLSLLFSSLVSVCIYLGYLSTDITGTDQFKVQVQSNAHS